MPIYKSSNSGIPFGNTAGRPANPQTGQPYFNGQLQRLELYTGATYGWQNIVAETPGVIGYTGSVIETNTTNTITVTGTNFAAGASTTLVGVDGTEYAAISTTVNNLTQLTAVFGVIPANNEPYDIRVTNPSNLYGVYYDVLSVNDKPIWTTAAGLLGTFNLGQSVSIQLAATDEENNSLSYALVSGSLPGGLSLSSSGLISGTISAGGTPQTFTFTITVSDSINIPQSRIFSIAYNVPVVTGGTLSSDSTYYYRTFTANSNLVVSTLGINADVLTVAGGGGGGGYNGGAGGGAGGVLYSSSQSFTPSTYSVTIGAGGPGAANASSAPTSNGINSSIGSLTATGGGAGMTQSIGSAGNGGSGGGAGGAGGSGNLTGTPGTGISGQGNNGGYGWAQNGNDGGGGGGGAGAVGGNGSTNKGGNGGSGTNTYSTWITAISSAMTGVSGWSTATSGGYIGGGGGGGSYSGSAASPGAGGGGAGGNGAGSLSSLAGTNNTGGGGGGCGVGGNSTSGGSNGGSGIVIVRYTKASVGG